MVVNKCLAFLFCLLVPLPVLAAQRVSARPKPAMDTGDQESIRQIIDMEHQAREASLRRDVEFSQRILAEDYVAITPLGRAARRRARLVDARDLGSGHGAAEHEEWRLADV